MAQLRHRNGNQQQHTNDESAQKRQWGDPYTADTANAWSGMPDSGSSSWDSCNCWDTSIFDDYGDECYYYCIDYWMYYSPTDYPTDYPTSDYYFGGSDYQTGNIQEEAYWIVEGKRSCILVSFLFCVISVLASTKATVIRLKFREQHIP